MSGNPIKTTGQCFGLRQMSPLATCACAAALFALCLSTALAEDTSLKDGAKRAGHAVGTTVREIGQGAKKAGKAVGGAAKEGGKEFVRAIKGESH